MDVNADLKLPGQPIQIPRGPAPQLSNGVYPRDGQVRASLVGIPVYQASVRVHQSTRSIFGKLNACRNTRHYLLDVFDRTRLLPTLSCLVL